MLKASRLTFILLLLFAPLAFGSVEPWAFFFLVLLTGAALLFYLVHCLLTGNFFYQIPGFAPLLLLAALLILQIIPLPEFLLEIISPRSLVSWHKTAGLFSGNAAWPISLDIKGGIYELARFFVCCGCYVLAVQLLSDGKMFKQTVLVVALFGGLLALFSILQSIFTVDRVLWIRDLPERSGPFGPYVNRNHYAGLMGMLLPVALALACACRPPRQFGSRREKIIGFFEDEKFFLFIMLCLSSVFIALSVFMTLSRGGIFSLCLSLLFFVSAVSWTGRRAVRGRRTGIIPVTVVVFFALVMALSWFGWEKLDQRFGGLPSTITSMSPAARYPILKNGLKMFKDFPLAGAGFGSFRNVFPKYHSVAPYGVVDHAHNDYLQLLVEGGIIGTGLLLVFFTSLFGATYRAFKKRKEPYAVLLCLGAASGLLAIFCHSFVDFNLHINANALYFSFLCALMVSAAHTRFREKPASGTYLIPFGTGNVRLTAVIFTVLLIPLLLFSAGQWAGVYYIGPFKQVEINRKTDPYVREQKERAAVRAFRFDPLEASYRVMEGDAAFAAGNFSRALAAYQKAVALRPTGSEILQKAGMATYLANGDIRQADSLMSAGVEFYPAHPLFYGRYADFLLKRGRTAEAREYIRRGLELDPYQADMFFAIMQGAKLTPAEMYAALADYSFVWARFAAYIGKTEYNFMKKEIMLKAVEAADREERPSPSIYLSLAMLFAQEKNHEEAITVLEKGLTRLPNHTALLYDLAALYEQLQITYKATELYEKILIINPDHQNARTRLEKLAK